MSFSLESFDSSATLDDENNKKPKRSDIFGNKIKKGGKKHKVVFADHRAAQQPLFHIHVVESYKKFNTDVSSKRHNHCCLIF